MQSRPDGQPVSEASRSAPSQTDESQSGDVIGWREWVTLPDLGLEWTKAKIDTGARSSAIDATDLEIVEVDGRSHARFVVHPWQASDADPVFNEVPIIDQRSVRSSNGQMEFRPVIRTSVILGAHHWTIDLTLTSRDGMGFRMLLGREALRRRVRIDPGHSYLMGTPTREILRRNRRHIHAESRS